MQRVPLYDELVRVCVASLVGRSMTLKELA